MDIKQFERLQSAVQWVADQQMIDNADPEERMHLVRHFQTRWGLAETVDESAPIDAVYQSNGGGWNIYENGQAVQVFGVCASAACLAGNVVLAHGDRFVVSVDPIDRHRMPDYETEEHKGATVVNHCLDDKGTMHYIATRAQTLLGITQKEANLLFDEKNSRSEIISMARKFADNYGHDLQVIT